MFGFSVLFVYLFYHLKKAFKIFVFIDLSISLFCPHNCWLSYFKHLFGSYSLKVVWQGCLLSPCLFNLYSEHIMQNAGLVELQARIRIAGRNINNLKYADDTTLMAESKEELKSLLMRLKEESEKACWKLNSKKLRSSHPVPSLHGK